MPVTKFGMTSLNNAFNSNSNNNFNAFTALKSGNILQPVRVKSIILDETHPKFKELGEWNALGIIEFDTIDNPGTNINQLQTARPLLSNNKSYPLVNEIVFLFSLPNTNIGEFTTSNDNYYLTTVALWNHPHHNAFPLNPNELPDTQRKDYVQTTAGSVRRVTDQSTEINLGKTFKEKSNIHPILPFEGDVIYEGRWGNSIRMGSTVKLTPNNWSKTGADGDPLTIIKNGQGEQTKEGWVPITEDININNSSIYLTSTQQIPLTPSSEDYNSYQTQPTSINKFSGNQIVVNSGRLVFNSSTEHILLSSAKSINLNAIGSLNFDTKNVIFNSNKIYLGSKSANEPLLLGNQTVILLEQLITNLKFFMDICSTIVSTPPGTPLGQLNVVSTQMSTILQSLSQNLESLKSKNNYTI